MKEIRNNNRQMLYLRGIKMDIPTKSNSTHNSNGLSVNESRINSTHLVIGSNQPINPSNLNKLV